MRKLTLVSGIILAVLLVGCVTTAGIPKWVADPRVSNNVIYGIGSAKMNDASRSREVALASARDDLTFSLQATVEAAMIRYAQDSGVEGDDQSLAFVESISKQIAEATLRLTRTDKTEIMRDGTMWVRIAQDLDDFYVVAEEELAAQEEFIRSEAAAYSEFKAEEALAAYIDENPPE